MSNGKYCPFCQRVIEPCNSEEVENGDHDGFIYIHDEDIEHDDDYNFEELH